MAEAKRIPAAKKEENPKEKLTALIFSDPAGNADKKCFFITPIGDINSLIRRETDGIYSASVLPALELCGIREENVNVSHKICTSGRIDKQIMMHLFEDELVIANLSEQNPNVMYELAVRHFIGKPVILIARDGTKFPFDVHNERIIHFVNDIMGSKDLIIEIEKAILMLDDYKADNIIYESVKEEKIQEAISATKNYTITSEAVEIIMNGLNSITSSMIYMNQKIDNNNRNYKKETITRFSGSRSLDFQVNVGKIGVKIPAGFKREDYMEKIGRLIDAVAIRGNSPGYSMSYEVTSENFVEISISNVSGELFTTIQDSIFKFCSSNSFPKSDNEKI